MKKLMQAIVEANNAYYNSGTPTMTDEQYDMLKQELIALAEGNPEKADEIGVNEVLDSVGAIPVGSTITHYSRMWSLANSRNEQELRSWYPTGQEVCTSDKEDGSGISLEYEGGYLQTGATRGNGTIGENITLCVKQLPGVPKTIPFKGKLQVTGEVTLPLENMEEAKELDQYEYKNARNAANGILRRQRENDPAKQLLQFHAYNAAFDFAKSGITTYYDMMTLLEQWGFATVQPTVYNDVDAAMGDIKRRVQERTRKPIMVDGVVVRINSLNAYEKMGYTSKAPKGATAFKFETVKAEVEIEEVLQSVGRKGKISPVAIYKPTDLGGITNDRCLLHTYPMIKRMGIKLGGIVVIEKCGDIIPQVESVRSDLVTGREKDIEEPTVCPICQEPVARRGDYLYCVNDLCDRQDKNKLLTFVTSIDFKGIGPVTAENLAANGSFQKPSDFFKLTVSDLVAASMAGKTAEKIVASIQEKRLSVTQKQIMQGLSIDYCGKGTAEDLIDDAGLKIQDMVGKPVNWFEKLVNLGPVKSASLQKWFNNPDNIAEIKELQSLGVLDNEIQKAAPTGSSLDGEIICITGTLSADKKEYYSRIEDAGGSFTESFSKKITKMVVGDKAGSKEEKARKAGITIWSEQDLIDALQS